MAFQSKSTQQAQGISLQGDTGAPPPDAVTSQLPVKVFSGAIIGKPPPYAPILIGSAQQGYFSSPIGFGASGVTMNRRNPVQMQAGGQTAFGGVGGAAKIKRPPKRKPRAGGAVILQGNSSKVRKAAASKQAATSLGGSFSFYKSIADVCTCTKKVKVKKCKSKGKVHARTLPSKTLAARKNKRPYIPVSLM